MVNSSATKPFTKTSDTLRCKCGSKSYLVQVYTDDEGERTWIRVDCKKCGHLLFYNGA